MLAFTTEATRPSDPIVSAASFDIDVGLGRTDRVVLCRNNGPGG